MDESIEIRPAVPEDAPSIASLSAQLGYPISEAEAADRLASIRSRSAAHEVLVAHPPGGPVVAWAHVFVAVRLETEESAELGGFVVDEDHRRCGIGRRLLEACEAWAARRGITRFRIRSRAGRDDARSFYEGNGYARAKQQNVFDKRLRPGR